MTSGRLMHEFSAGIDGQGLLEFRFEIGMGLAPQGQTWSYKVDSRFKCAWAVGAEKIQ